MRRQRSSAYLRPRPWQSGKPAVGVVLGIAALLASACVGSGGGPDGEMDGDQAGLAFAVLDPDAAAPALDVDGALRGGTIRVASGRTPNSLDPTRASSEQERAILSLVVRSLTQYQLRDGKPVLVPDLATDLGKPNKNFTEWTYRLRDGLYYEDGTEVTAEHVAHAIRRQLATEELPDGFTYGSEYYLDGGTYRGPWESGDNFRAVTVLNDRTLRIKLRKPFPDLPFYAALPAFSPIPPDEDSKGSYVNKLLATGPYKFEKYVPGNQLILTPNELWNPGTDTTRRQYVDRWIFTFGQSTATAQNEVAADENDDASATVVPDPLSAETYAKIEAAGAESKVKSGIGPCAEYAYLDTREIPTKVRRAIAAAWPVEQEREAAGDIEEVTWAPSASLLPAGTPGRLAYDVTGTEDGARGGTKGGAKGAGQGDPKAARRLLGEAGEEGFELSYYYEEDDSTAEEINEVRVDALEEAGFTVEPIGVDDPAEAAADSEAPVNIRFETTCSPWPGGGSTIPLRWSGDAEAGTDLSYLTEPDLAKQIGRASRLPSPEGMVEWGKLDKEIMQTYLPAVPLGEVRGVMLVGSKIGNAEIDPVTGMPNYSAMYLKE